MEMAIRLLLTAETSCYWYWTGQEIWDRQVTDAANLAFSIVKSDIANIADKTGPTIFPAWITPENPGGKAWGAGGLVNASRESTLHTFIYDVSGIDNVSLFIRSDGKEIRLPMKSHGPYPSQTNPTYTATYFTAELPVGIGDIRYFIEATDMKGNRSVSSLERIFLA
jgi:hypothetical protein